MPLNLSENRMKTQTVKIIRLQKLCYFAYRFIFSILSLKSCLIYFSSKSSLFFLLHKFSVIIFCAKLLSPNQTIYSIVCDIIVVQVLNLVCLRPHGLQHARLPSFTISWSLLKLMSIESVMPSNHLVLHHPLFSSPQSSPAPGSLPMSWLFASGGQSIGVLASASVLPMNIQG